MAAMSPDDLSLFLKLHQSFLVYVAQQTGMSPGLKTRDDFLRLGRDAKVKVGAASFRRRELLDGFVISNPFGFSSEEIEIIRSWAHHVKATFLIAKVTREGAVFLEEKGGRAAKAYLVLPLVSPFEDVLPFRPPVRADALLLPFKGRIVYDGWLLTYPIYFGGGMSRSIRAACDDAIVNHGLVKSLPFAPEDRKEYTDEERLLYYLKTKERREEHDEEVEEILRKNTALLPIYHGRLGKVNSKHQSDMLREVGVEHGWFAIAGDVIVASGKTRDEVLRAVDAVLPEKKRKAAYIFELG